MVESPCLCDGTWVEVLCMPFMCYLIYYYFKYVVDHDK